MLLLIFWIASWASPKLQHWTPGLLFFSALIGLTTIAAWHKHITDTRTERALERAAAGFCPKCDYDRRALDPAAACPECGEKRS